MKHLNEGTLRRLLDEPELIHAQVHGHLGGCAVCRAHAAQVARDAGRASSLLAVSAAALDTLDVEGALARIRRTIGGGGAGPLSHGVEPVAQLPPSRAGGGNDLLARAASSRHLQSKGRGCPRWRCC